MNRISEPTPASNGDESAWYSMSAMPIRRRMTIQASFAGHSGPDPERCHTRCLLSEHSLRFGVHGSRRIFVVETFRQPDLVDRPPRSRTALPAQLGPAQRSLAAHANGRDREWDQLAATEFLNYD